MAIPATQIVQVSPRLLQPGGSDLEINGLFLTRDASIPVGSVLEFSDQESVGEQFGTLSDEYNLAGVYLNGYDNSFAKPFRGYFARRLDQGAAPFLRGGKMQLTLAALREIDSATLTLALGNHTDTLAGLDFSTATSFSDAASIVQTAINAVGAGGESWEDATVEYSSLFSAFVITGGVADGDQIVDFASGDAAGALRLTRDDGAVISQGSDALSLADNMREILSVTANWVTFTSVWEADNEEALEFAEWATGQGVEYLYVGWSDDPVLAQASAAQTLADILDDENIGSATLVYGGPEYAAFVMGTAASIDWNRLNGAITFAFKSQEGLAPSVVRSAEALNLLAKRVNFYGKYATRNDDFRFFHDGSMFGRYRFIDPYINAVWLNNAIQVSLMNGLTQAGRVSYTRSGYALVRAWMMDPVKRALNNGVIDVGLELSESQKAELFREAGRDISGELAAYGYVIQVADPGAQARVNRDSPVVSLWYTYGGSIHKLVVASTAVV